jgi:NitT/TauT family transport system substrate-binding protein
MTRQLRRLTVAAATVLLLASACASNGGSEGDGNGDLVEPARVTYLTGFGTFGREAYAYVALDKGYFTEESIEVDIQPGGGTIPNITQTVEGVADFALADFTGVLLAYGGDLVPREFRVVAAVQQQTVFSIIALEGSGITSPRDLEGKLIGDGPGSFGPLLFPAYANLAGIDADLVTIDNNIQPQNLPASLASGAVDAIGQFLLGKPTIEAASGRTAIVLPFSDYLRDLYGISLVTATETAENDPELVQRFTRALLRGLEYALANPAEAGEILERYEPAQTAAVAAQEVELMVPYSQPSDPNAPLGYFDRQRVAQSIAILEAAGAIPPGMVPEDVVEFSLVPGFEG